MSSLTNARVFAASLVAVSLAALPPALSAADSVDLRLRLKENQTYRVDVETTVDTEIVAAGQAQKIGIQLGMGMAYRVERVERATGRLAVRVTFDRASMRMQMADGSSLAYDSRRPGPDVPPLMLAIASLVGQEFGATFNPDGSVVEIRGADEMIESMLRSMKLPEGQLRTALEESTRQQFSAPALKQMMSTTAIYPARPVSVGDTWTRDVPGPPGTDMSVTNTFTLRKREGGRAFIAMAATFAIDSPMPAPAGTTPARAVLSGSHRGEFVMDEATGWTVAAQISQTGGGSVNGMPMKLTTTIALTGK